MSGFASDWLALRAEADARARDAGLLALAAEAAVDGLIVDLGAGAGATMSALAPLAPRARWRLLDDDAGLLNEALARASANGVPAQAERRDLAEAVDAAFDPAPALVAGSAFFDLVSASWIARFAAAARRTGTPVYAALTYDGRERWEPHHPEDASVRARFLVDMRRDKGFGPALGPQAGRALAAALAAEGMKVRTAPSTWRLCAPRDAGLIAALADGQADAAGASDAWRQARRRAQRVEIGHIDLFAAP